MVTMLCGKCSLPNELCMCENIVRSQSELFVSVEKRTYGKLVTCINGVNKDIDSKKLLKALKKRCAAGGTKRNGALEIQGDHMKKVVNLLETEGFRVLN